jgi:condensin-2 complex subunit D3
VCDDAGKVCLLNEEFAKRHLAAMARELHVCPDAVVRNNVMLVLCDLCMRYGRRGRAKLAGSKQGMWWDGLWRHRYAALMDKYIPTLAASLHDPSELVRRQALTMLTRMLQVRQVPKAQNVAGTEHVREGRRRATLRKIMSSGKDRYSTAL